jgi:Uma2 family endonuclease
MPPSGGYASSAQGEVFYALRRWQQEVSDHGLLLQDVFVAFPGGLYAAPDIAWWSATTRPAVWDGALDVVPGLVVEVLSPKTRENDLGVKRDMYLASGVQELWLVDPPAKSVTLVAAGRGDVEMRRGETLRSALLADFALPLDRIFVA